jgi:hypothetical protein
MEAQRRKRGKRGRRKHKEFMDAALDAYIRHLALQKWREMTDLQETLGVDLVRTAREAGRFPERGAYRGIWERWWQDEVVAHAAASAAPLFECIETAIQPALREEIDIRQQHGDVPLGDTLAYKVFLDQALDRLFEEEAGSLEEL